MFHTYIDWTLEETPRPFYVGKGNEGRMRKPERNNKHLHIVRTFGWRREIVVSSDDEAQCFRREIELIAEHHTYVHDSQASDIACNFTTGGEGVAGWHPTEQTRKKIGLGSIRTMSDPAMRQRISSTLTGRIRTAEHSANISRGKRGKSSGWSGRKQTPEHIANRIASRKANRRKRLNSERSGA